MWWKNDSFNRRNLSKKLPGFAVISKSKNNEKKKKFTKKITKKLQNLKK